MTIELSVDGRSVSVEDGALSLLDALREELGVRGPKDGCSPQGQCGCCTVWVDGAPRVACVTPVRRLAGRAVTTTAGLPEETARRWADAMVAAGASQCGFCTPGIVMRLAALERRTDGATAGAARRSLDEAAIRSALAAHLCRCTGWQTIVEAAGAVLGVAVGPGAGSVPGAAGVPGAPGGTGDAACDPPGGAARDPLLSSWRAQLEGPSFQTSTAATVLGRAGFADDTAPRSASVAVPSPEGGLVVERSLRAARDRSAMVQGRNSPVPLRHPLEIPDGDWTVTLRTAWVEPAYLEPDASWCAPGGVPASPLANGGAFGGKRRSPVASDARRLADERAETVRVLWPREEVVRRGPKRPPVAAGVRADGSGVLRVARTASARLDGYADRVRSAAPNLLVEEVEVAGPAVSVDLRCAGWLEATVLAAVARALSEGTADPGSPVEVAAPSGGRAKVAVEPGGAVDVEVWAGEVLDEVVLRSYCLGAVHQALGLVRSEGIAVDEAGTVHDLTIRSYGILPARDTPWMNVMMHREARWPINGSDAVLAATAAAAWITDGLAPSWPTRTGGRR